MDSDGSFDKLQQLAAAAGLTVLKCTEWHLQVRGGAVLVNWYPSSKRRSAYIAGTTTGIPFCAAADVIKLAQGHEPSSVGIGVAKEPKNKKRRPNLTHHKQRLMRKHPFCHWCNRRVFDPKTHGPCDPNLVATVDHFVPRSKGGLDHSNNYVLACNECNAKRSNSMPPARASERAAA